MLGGHAGSHPAPGPPPAAAGAQAPGPPLLPHAVHCKEARGRWQGRSVALSTARSSTNQELGQLSDCSSLALPWICCQDHPFGPGHSPWGRGLGDVEIKTSSPSSHRTPPVDIHREIPINLELKGPSLWGARERPQYPPHSTPSPILPAPSNMTGLRQGKYPPSGKRMDTQKDTNLYVDSDTKSSHFGTQLHPSPLQAPTVPPEHRDPLPRLAFL